MLDIAEGFAKVTKATIGFNKETREKIALVCRELDAICRLRTFSIAILFGLIAVLPTKSNVSIKDLPQ
jgi:hypothetical protein